MDLPFLPLLWQDPRVSLASRLHQRHAGRLAILRLGALVAKGRRTVTSWIRAARVGRGWAAYYYFLAALGRRADVLAGLLLRIALRRLAPDGPLLFASDDRPTRRCGEHVQGAGVHHHPTPGPAAPKFHYGHVWVTLAWVVTHPLWGAIGLPLLGRLNIRHKDVPGIPRRLGWLFRTKLELAAVCAGSSAWERRSSPRSAATAPR
jgi:hypothetical protein